MKTMRFTKAFKRKFQRVVALAMAMVLVTTSCPTVPVAYGADGIEVEPIELVEGALVEEGADEAVIQETDEAITDETQGEPGDETPDATGQPEQTDEAENSGEAADEQATGTVTLEVEGDPSKSLGDFSEKDITTTDDGGISTGTITFSGKGKTYILTVDGILHGNIVVKDGAKLTVRGNGKIDATGRHTSVIEVKGTGDEGNITLLRVEGEVTITGGTGTLMDRKFSGDTRVAGGGILLQRKGWEKGGARLELTGGKIVNNTAQAGGGIYIDTYCGFNMTGGMVSENKTIAQSETNPAHEGGGIFFAGNGDGGNNLSTAGSITAGTISGNTSQTTTDWGGGGVYINNSSTLKIGIARITGNTAEGLGGGVAGCPHAHIGIGNITNGAPIYGNDALKIRQPMNEALNSNSGGLSGDQFAYGNEYYKGNETWSMDEFTADKAKDYYCTELSYVFGYDLGQKGEYAWRGYQAGTTGGFDVKIEKGEPWITNDASLGLTNTLTDQGGSFGTDSDYDVFIENNTSWTHGGGVGCNGNLMIGEMTSENLHGKLSFDIAKSFVNSLGKPLPLPEGDIAFKFELLDASGTKVLDTAENDAHGQVTFSVDAEPYIKGKNNGESFETTFLLREKTDNPKTNVKYDAHTYKVTVKGKVQVKSYNDKINNVTVSSTNVDKKAGLDIKFEQLPCDDAACDSNIKAGFVNDDGELNVPEGTTIDKGTFNTAAEGYKPFTITNTLELKTDFTLTADKYWWGEDKDAAFDFTLQEVQAVDVDKPGALKELKVVEGSEPMVVQNGAFDKDGKAVIEFKDLAFSEAGEHWYRLTENSVDGMKTDSSVYVFKVLVKLNGTETALTAKLIGTWYGETPDSTTLTPFEGTPDFYNTDGIVLGSYRVNANSGEALEKRCLVDPKVYKELEGRSLKGGEFTFQLVQADVDYQPVGQVISTASNDRFGMVDFDAANPVAGTEDDPCCLLFTSAGTFRYVVVEDPSVKPDSTILYDNTTITFTVVISEENGELKATDMYYGHLVDGKNVRYSESGMDSQNWHPTLVNKVKGMDLKVRKTSETDRTLGLEGATYGLYAVSTDGQADLLVAEGKSDADGWIYYKNVNLTLDTTYYFRESDTPPEGYTVSEFRSPYFQLKVDTTAPGGYVLSYDLGDNPELGDSKLPAAGEAAVAELDAELEGEAPVEDGKSDHGTFADDGNLVLVYDRDGGVSDAPTHLEFTKLDGRTHDWIEGAKLAIIEKDSGKTVMEWTSGAAPEVLDGVLNVGTTYILRELEAPENYALADDVEFVLDKLGKVQILSGDGILDEVQERNAELTGDTLVLYNTMYNGEEVLTERRERVREVPGEDTVIERPGGSTTTTTTTGGGTGSRTGGTLPTTGDPALDLTILVAAVGVLGGTGVVLGKRRKNRKQ